MGVAKGRIVKQKLVKCSNTVTLPEFLRKIGRTTTRDRVEEETREVDGERIQEQEVETYREVSQVKFTNKSYKFSQEEVSEQSERNIKLDRETNL